MKRVNGAAAQIRVKLNVALSVAHGMRLGDYGPDYRAAVRLATERLQTALEEWDGLAQPVEIVEGVES